MSALIAKTHLYGPDNKGYCVSTVYRHSDVAAAPEHCHYETLVWQWNPKAASDGRGAVVDQGAAGCLRLALERHHQLCMKWAQVMNPDEDIWKENEEG